MRLHPRLAALLIVGSLSLTTLAAPLAPPQPVRQVEGISEYRLANGLQVLLIPDASKPTVTVNVTYHVGSRMEGYGETGMAHLLEHLMFKTTQLHANVGAELSKRGMEFNGSTNSDRTNYYETFPADPAQLAWALKTEADRMTGAKILRKDLDTEMTVVRNEMEAGENDPINILIERTQAAAYQWHSYGRSTIGARADVENVAIPSLQAFYRKYYQPDNATLLVAGAFDAAKVLQQINSEFGRLAKPARKLPPASVANRRCLPVTTSRRWPTATTPPSRSWPRRWPTPPTAACTSAWWTLARPPRCSAGPRAMPSPAC